MKKEENEDIFNSLKKIGDNEYLDEKGEVYKIVNQREYEDVFSDIEAVSYLIDRRLEDLINGQKGELKEIIRIAKEVFEKFEGDDYETGRKEKELVKLLDRYKNRQIKLELAQKTKQSKDHTLRNQL